MYEDEEQLFNRYRRTKDNRFRQVIFERYKDLIISIAYEQKLKNYHLVEIEDIICYGTFGLLDAIERFDVNRKVSFTTYAITRIKGSIKDELEQNIFGHISPN